MQWIFDDVQAWIDNPEGSKLYWLCGSGGTGKSVVAAVALREFSEHIVGYHFCRHNFPKESDPVALLKSLCAYLCAHVTGFVEALTKVNGQNLRKYVAEGSSTEMVFKKLIQQPLGYPSVKTKEKVQFIVLDALDEIPRHALGAFLEVTPPYFSLELRLVMCSYPLGEGYGKEKDR